MIFHLTIDFSLSHPKVPAIMNAIEKVQVIKIDSLTVFDGPIDVISKRKFVLVIERKLFFHSGEKSS